MEFKFPLTEGQKAGYDLFAQFFMDPMENVMLLKGWSGTGKSTLIQYILQNLPRLNDMIQLLYPDYVKMDVALTATTNPAAEALYTSIDMVMPVTTVHSKLGLILRTDYQSNKKELVINPKADRLFNTLLIVDEASYIDQHLLGLIFKQIENCKILFVGDPAQCTPISSTYMPAFKMDKNQIELTEPTRYAPNTPLSRLIENLRDTVLTNTWHKFEMDNLMLHHVDQCTFEHMALEAFQNEDKAGTSKILAYTNDRVMHYNNLFTSLIDGEHQPYVGQRMVSNDMANIGSSVLKNGEEVVIEHVTCTVEHEVPGYLLRLRNKTGEFFVPLDRKAKKARNNQARAEGDYTVMKITTDEWADLRPTYSCTVNKSQGSTFNTGFIDLNDLCSKIRSGNQLARALYVGTSRFRDRVIFTGDITNKG